MRVEREGITLTDEITVRLVNSTGGDHMVVAAAKVSTSGEDALAFASPGAEEGNAGLINYLLKHRHGTPFEHSQLTFFIHAPAMVWWEWVRHRIGHSFNLESGRYRQLEPVFWVPRRDRKLVNGPDHKSARPAFVEAGDGAFDFSSEVYGHAYRTNWKCYQSLLGQGVANEAARAVLGFGVYYSGWVTVNPRSLMAFLSLRVHDDDATFPTYPQAEIQEAASACEALFRQGWPITHAAFVKHGRVAP